MSPDQIAWARWIDAGTLLARIEARLASAGDVEGLRRIGRMSAQEQSILLRQEATGR